MRVAALIVFVAVAFQSAPPGRIISGRVVDASGSVPSNVGLCAAVRDGPTSYSCRPVPIAADGSFRSTPLPPGTYALVVGPAPELPGDADVDGGLAFVELGERDVSGVTITVRRYRVRGKYVMRSNNPAARWPTHMHVTPLLVGPKDAPALSDISEGASNGEFVLHNVFGKRILRPGYSASGPDRWWFAGVLL